jgi:hypothetical protein
VAALPESSHRGSPRSFILDGEAVVHRRRQARNAILFDLIE